MNDQTRVPTLDELAEQIRTDAGRARQLRQALQWLTEAEKDVEHYSSDVIVQPKFVIAGADAASAEIARHYENIYPQAIALVREMCRHELERINKRYLPVLMPVPEGSEA